MNLLQCTRKTLLDLIIEKKPELEDIVLRQIESGEAKIYRTGNAASCYLCNGHNLCCPDYHIYRKNS